MNQAQKEYLASLDNTVSEPEEVIADPQKFRTVVQGATYGFGEEIEAAVRSVLPGLSVLLNFTAPCQPEVA